MVCLSAARVDDRRGRIDGSVRGWCNDGGVIPALPRDRQLGNAARVARRMAIFSGKRRASSGARPELCPMFKWRTPGFRCSFFLLSRSWRRRFRFSAFFLQT